MQYILTSAQMQQCDATTMEKFHLPSAVLMERAALAAVETLLSECPKPLRRVLIVCGVGNNGGDGLAMARLLFLKGYTVDILFPGKEEKASVEAARQLSIVRSYGIPLFDGLAQLPNGPYAYDAVVDALFGIGLTREVGGIYREVIDGMNTMSSFKLAVDIPSGIHGDNGHVMGVAFRADVTVTFGFAKIGQLLFPGAAYTGKLCGADIGIDAYSLPEVKPSLLMLDKTDLAELPKRTPDTNKGSYGKVLIFAGSRNMAGAAAFAAKAAYRMGSGLVKVVTDAANRVIIQSLVPEAILAVYDAATEMEPFVKEQLSWADAVVIGPGISTSEQANQMVRCVFEQASVPCLVDADGLNLLAKHKKWLRNAKNTPIITPHVGEMSRLCEKSIDEIKAQPLATAKAFALAHGCIVVLKDARSVIATPEGTAWINTSGNNGMATAGSGDVLSGIIGSLIGQGTSPEEAAVLGAYVHGLAGDAAAKECGKASMMATDIIENIAKVLLTV